MSVKLWKLLVMKSYLNVFFLAAERFLASSALFFITINTSRRRRWQSRAVCQRTGVCANMPC